MNADLPTVPARCPACGGSRDVRLAPADGGPGVCIAAFHSVVGWGELEHVAPDGYHWAVSTDGKRASLWPDAR